ncbi:MAG: hypothetical protein CSB44_09760 [Gammaproteobacteria bacterium]|nr:MAG: hypothetical protein CSB44_09760 [Gammaproteobacteria bacterium]PIE36359.1 MAG: hypothetical protein CSA54_04685 [Gammaproteobacteria bacterium]
MNVLMVEDHRLVADAMQVWLREIDPDINVTTCYSTQHALTVADSGECFDLVLTDLLMPGIDGLGLLVGLRNRNVSAPVIIVSGSDDDRYIRAAMDQGAAGFIPKTLPGAEMIASIKRVLAGEPCFPDRFTNNGNETSNPADGYSVNRGDMPSKKQLQVLQLMAEGHSNKQISQIVGISEATVKYHTSQLFKLFGVKNRTSCVREAQRRGLLRGYESNGVT